MKANCPKLGLIFNFLLCLVLISCGQVNKQQEEKNLIHSGEDSEDHFVLVYPHPADYAFGENHGDDALDKDNKLVIDRCNGCHQLLSEDREGAPGCRSCHKYYPHTDQGEAGIAIWSKASEHGSASLNDLGKFENSRCSGCHNPSGTESTPIAGCYSCHNNYPHQEGWGTNDLHVAHLARGSGTFKERLDSACATECHGSDYNGGLSNVACRSCHDGQYPHQQNYQEQTVHGFDIFSDSANKLALCQNCHGDNYQGGKYATACTDCHQMPNKQNSFQHEPVNQNDCTTCHASNQAEVKADHLLKNSQPGLCQDCHDQGKGPSNYNHSAVNSDPACANCHKPHDSSIEHLLANSQQLLCFNCHDQQLTSSEYGTTRNIKNEFENSTNLHQPFAQGSCNDCHETHDPNYNHQLKGPDSMFRVTSAQDSWTCFACHDYDTYVGADESMNKPANNHRPAPDLDTQFVRLRLSDAQNLHRYHSKRWACLSCHSPHATNSAKLMRNWFAQVTVPNTRFYEYADCTHTCHNPPLDLDNLW